MSLREGPLETQERGPPVQVCQQDLETRPTTEPSKVSPHDRNDDLRGGDLQDELKSLLEEEEQPQLQPPSCEWPQEGLADDLEQPPDKLSLPSRAFLEEEEEVAVPRAGISCSAGSGPNPKVRGSSHLEPTLTVNDQSHEKS